MVTAISTKFYERLSDIILDNAERALLVNVLECRHMPFFHIQIGSNRHFWTNSDGRYFEKET